MKHTVYIPNLQNNEITCTCVLHALACAIRSVALYMYLCQLILIDEYEYLISANFDFYDNVNLQSGAEVKHKF